MMKCSDCKFRRKVKEPVGGCRKHGYRMCLKMGTVLKKQPVYDHNGLPTGRMTYPEDCKL